MSGFVSNLEDEAAGKVLPYLAIVASIIVPFAAPAVFGAIAASGALGSGLAAAAAAGTMSTMATTLGSAAVGGLMNAGIAAAQGADGDQLWGALATGALSAGAGAFARGLGGAANASTGAATSGANILGGAGPVPIGPSAATASTAIGAPAVNTGASGMFSSIASAVSSNPETVQRVLQASANAALQMRAMARTDKLTEQQLAALEEIQNRELAAYNIRADEANKILRAADRMDPAWRGRMAMADAAGIGNREANQAMRNISVRQGGSLDAGQRKAYERGSSLRIARDKTLAYNQGFNQGEVAQNQLRATGIAALGSPPGFQTWAAQTELRAAQERQTAEAEGRLVGGLAAAVRPEHQPASSPTPGGMQEEDEDPISSGFRPFLYGPGG